MKKTKIVCTIGPKSEPKAVMAKMIEAGMNVMRLNFSHGDHPEHQRRVDGMRNVMKKTGLMVGILQDLGGPKIRIGKFKEKMIMHFGMKFILLQNFMPFFLKL